MIGLNCNVHASREWAKPYKLRDLDIQWHMPGEKEIESVEMLLKKYLVPELEVLNNYVEGKIALERQELRIHLKIVSACLACNSVLPQWEEPALQL